MASISSTESSSASAVAQKRSALAYKITRISLVPSFLSLTRAQFEQLSDVPPEAEWLANITNLKTRRAYKEDVREFIGFTGLHDYIGLRSVVRSHIIAWRKDMERRGLAPATIRRKLAALSSLLIISVNAMLSPATRWTG
jgi:integrase family protein with SAM-like domain